MVLNFQHITLVIFVIENISSFTAQDMSLANGVFLILPVLCWYPVRTFNMLRQLTKLETWFWIGGIEFLVSFLKYLSNCVANGK